MEAIEIRSQAEFEAFCQAAQHMPLLALDTEFMRERTYYPKLCLLQLATDDQIVLVDPFILKSYQPLVELLTNKNILKIFHSAQQDLEVLEHSTGAIPEPLYDTQIAATFLGSKNQIGYADLAFQEVNIRLDKSHTRTDWTRRPLSTEQLAYAANDVRYLIEIYQNQTKQLKNLNRFDWYQDEMKLFIENSTRPLEPQDLWKKVKGGQSLRGKQLNVLKEYAIWRENIAKNKDRPRRFVIKDDLLIDIVKLKIHSENDLENLRQLPKSLSNTDLQDLFSAREKAMQQDKSEWPVIADFVRLSKAQECISDCMMSIVKSCAEKNGLSTELIATRKNIDGVISNSKDNKLMQGWRYDVAGQYLEKFLQGKLQISSDGDKLNIEPRA